MLSPGIGKGLNVAYDIDLLGKGYREPENRTGLYRVVEHVAEGLAQSGCNVNFVAQNYLEAAVEYLASNARLEGQTIKVLKKKLPERTLDTLHAYLSRAEQAALHRHYNYPETFPIGARAYRKALFSLHALLPTPPAGKALKIDPQVFKRVQVYHSPFSRITETIRESSHLKCFQTIYDLIPILLPQYVDAAVTAWTQQAIASLNPEDWVFSISEATKNDLCNYRKDINPDHVIVTYLAAAEEKFFPYKDSVGMKNVKNKFNIPVQEKYLLGVSTMLPHKNFVRLIRCFKRVLEQEHIRDLYLVLVGTKGSEAEKIMREIQATTWLRERVVFTGRVDDADLAPLYSGAMAFVYLSYYEGFGLPPLEAMQCGVPVITSNTSSLPEVVGDAGIMARPDDEDAICQALLRVYHDSGLRGQMSKASLRQASKFSWDKCVEQTITGYRTALTS